MACASNWALQRVRKFMSIADFASGLSVAQMTGQGGCGTLFRDRMKLSLIFLATLAAVLFGCGA